MSLSNYDFSDLQDNSSPSFFLDNSKSQLKKKIIGETEVGEYWKVFAEVDFDSEVQVINWTGFNNHWTILVATDIITITKLELMMSECDEISFKLTKIYEIKPFTY